MGFLGLIFPFILIFGIMYLFMILPQQRRDKERRSMLDALAKGDQVVTTGGVCGSIVGLSEQHVVLRVDEDTTIKFVRGAVAQVVSKDGDS